MNDITYKKEMLYLTMDFNSTKEIFDIFAKSLAEVMTQHKCNDLNAYAMIFMSIGTALALSKYPKSGVESLLSFATQRYDGVTKYMKDNKEGNI